jgi:hypothetical protein
MKNVQVNIDCAVDPEMVHPDDEWLLTETDHIVLIEDRASKDTVYATIHAEIPIKVLEHWEVTFEPFT